MNTIRHFLITIVLTGLTFAQMQFSGHIEDYADWDEDVIITGSVWVDDQATLIIQSGVTVYFQQQDMDYDGIGDWDFTINGQLVANGVVFTSYAENPAPGDWGGIDFTSSNGSANFIDSEIRYAHQGLHVNGNYVTLNNTTIANCSDYGIRVENSTQTSSFTQVNILDNGSYGMNVENAPVSIIGGLIFGNGSYGFKSNSGSDVSVNDLIVSSNASTGIWINSSQGATFDGIRSVSNGGEGILIVGADPVFTNSLISNNSGLGVKISESSSSPVFDYCDIKNNNYSGFWAEDGGSLTVTYSNILFNGGNAFTIFENSACTVNSCNIYSNTSTNINSAGFIQYEVPDNILYRSSNGNSSTFNFIPTVSGQTQFHVSGYGDHDHSNDDYRFYIKDNGTEVYQYIRENTSGDTNYDLWATATANGSGAIYVNLNCYSVSGPWGKVSEIKSPTSTIIGTQFISGNWTGVINAQYNWWGQINGIDELIIQVNPGTVDYGQSQITEIPDIGATFDNLSPSITITSPGVMVSDPGSITITWSDMDVDDDASISFYFEEEMGSGGSLITSGISEDNETDSYTWNLSGVPYGIYYIYGVINDGTNEPLTSYAPSQVMVGPLTISLPSDASAPAGSSLLIPVDLINPTDSDGIISFSFQLGYNPGILEADSTIGIVTANTLSSGWFVTANFNTPGQLNVIGYGVETIADRGTLLEIPFNVKSWASNFDEVNLNMNNFIFNTGEPDPEIINGLFTVINEFDISGSVEYYASGNSAGLVYGIPAVSLELNDEEGISAGELSSGNDGSFSFESIPSANYSINTSYDEPIASDANPPIISPYDAALVAMYQVNLVEFTTSQVIAGDVDGDGSIYAYDAALILYYSVGLSDAFAAGRWAFPGDHSYELLQDFANQSISGIAIGDPSGNWVPADGRGRTSMELAIDALEGEEVIILATTNDEFQSVLLDFQFNPEMLEFKEIIVSSELSNFYGTENLEEGRFRYGAFSSSSTQVSSEAYTLIFEARADLQSEIMLGDAFFDESPGDISLGESEQLQGDINGDLSLNILDIVLLVDYILGIIELENAELADVTGDGQINVLDVVTLVHMVLGNEGLSRDTGSKAVIQKGPNSLHLESDGNITIQLTLEHEKDFILSFTDNSYLSKAHTVNNRTEIIIINPNNGVLFTTNDIFSVEDIIGASSMGYINVDIIDIPTEYSISQAYPNPFNPVTTFNWTLAAPSSYSIIAYNIMGREVAVLEQGWKDAGRYNIVWDAKDIPSGIYFIKFKAGSKIVDIKKAMLLK